MRMVLLRLVFNTGTIVVLVRAATAAAAAAGLLALRYVAVEPADQKVCGRNDDQGNNDGLHIFPFQKPISFPNW